MENLVTKVQKLVVVALAVLLLVVVVLSTAHLGVLVVEEIWKPPRFLIPWDRRLFVFHVRAQEFCFQGIRKRTLLFERQVSRKCCI
jgi:hypothetical protein